MTSISRYLKLALAAALLSVSLSAGLSVNDAEPASADTCGKVISVGAAVVGLVGSGPTAVAAGAVGLVFAFVDCTILGDLIDGFIPDNNSMAIYWTSGADYDYVRTFGAPSKTYSQSSLVNVRNNRNTTGDASYKYRYTTRAGNTNLGVKIVNISGSQVRTNNLYTTWTLSNFYYNHSTNAYGSKYFFIDLEVAQYGGVGYPAVLDGQYLDGGSTVRHWCHAPNTGDQTVCPAVPA